MCAITVDAAQKQRLNDTIEVHNLPFVSQRSIRHKNNDLTTPMAVHIRRAAVTVDQTQKQPLDDHSRFTFGALPSRSMRHKNNDLASPSRFTFGALPLQSIRQKNNDLATSSRFTFGALPSRSIRRRKRLDDPLEVHIWRAAVTVDATQKQ